MFYYYFIIFIFVFSSLLNHIQDASTVVASMVSDHHSRRTMWARCISTTQTSHWCHLIVVPFVNQTDMVPFHAMSGEIIEKEHLLLTGGGKYTAHSTWSWLTVIAVSLQGGTNYSIASTNNNLTTARVIRYITDYAFCLRVYVVKDTLIAVCGADWPKGPRTDC